MQTQRSNYRRRQTSISIRLWSKKGPGLLGGGVQADNELQEAGEGDKGQRQAVSIFTLMVLTGFGFSYDLRKMNRVFLLFINSQIERE